MNDRKNIKWMPFDSLFDSKEVVKEIIQDKKRINFPILSNDEEENIEEEILKYYYANDLINITYYKNGYLYKKKLLITKIDKINKLCYFNDNSYIHFKQIISVN